MSAVTPPSQPIMIRDTSAQDQVLRAPARSTQWRRWLWPGLAAVAVLAGIG
ncbi:efflux transporter periplasmic adaptor subunit, partial [Xanthomonas oryzae pv. oryzae]